MSLLDWTIFFAFLAWVVIDGVRRARKDGDASERFLAGRSAPWWMMGLSIMATQASAITMLGTTGFGWQEGLRFAQFYFGLPLAMVILAFTVLPLYRRFNVFTVYEYLGKRFDARTRLVSASIFLVLRGLSVGIVIFAPSLVLSAVFGVSTEITIGLMGVIAVSYTTIGGMRAVLSTDVKQMSVMLVGLFVVLYCALAALPEGVGLTGALDLARVTDRLVLVDTAFDPGEKYTIWSALLGGTLIFLAYFGCDQSQAQRFLAGRSLAHERGALLLNAVAKVPFQILVLFVGVMMFAHYTFEAPPASFVPRQAVEARGEAPEIEAARAAWEKTRAAALDFVADSRSGDSSGEPAEYLTALEEERAARTGSLAVLRAASGNESKETNFVLPHFILTVLPAGLIGLLIAAIFAAALSSIDSELNAMATVWVMDLHPRGRARTLGAAGERRASAIAMATFGAIATGFAFFAQEVESLVEAVNQVGSYFYGSLLGVMVLAIATKRVGGVGAVSAMVAGVVAVGAADLLIPLWYDEFELPFLYFNTIGTTAAIWTGLIVSCFERRPPAATTSSLSE